MSAIVFSARFRDAVRLAWVCRSWKECMAGDGMWSAIGESMHATGKPWRCSCGSLMNIEIEVATARKEWTAWLKSSAT